MNSCMQALLRRLEKRILVPLPNHEARYRMFTSLLEGRCSDDVDLEGLADHTDGYSGGWAGGGSSIGCRKLGGT